VWSGGGLISQNFNGNAHGNIGSPTSGFRLSSDAAGTSTDPNIYGAYIRGSIIDVTDTKVRAVGYNSNFGRVSNIQLNGTITGPGYGVGFDSSRVCSLSYSRIKVEGWARAQGLTVTANIQYRINSGSWVTMDSKTLNMMGYQDYAYLYFAEYFNVSLLPETGYAEFRIILTDYGTNPSSSGVLITIANS